MAITPHHGTPLLPQKGNEWWRRASGPRTLNFTEISKGNRAQRRAARFGQAQLICVAHDTIARAQSGKCQRCRRGRKGLVKPIARNLTPVIKLAHDADRTVNRIAQANEEAA